MVVERDQYRLGPLLLLSGFFAAAWTIGFVVSAKSAPSLFASFGDTLLLLIPLFLAGSGLLVVAGTLPKYHDTGPAFVVDLEGVTFFYRGVKFLYKAETRKFPWNSVSDFAVQITNTKGGKVKTLLLRTHSGKKHVENLNTVKPSTAEVMASFIEHVEKAGFTTRPKHSVWGYSKTHLLVEKASIEESEQQV